MSGRAQILSFLRNPKSFADSAPDPEIWRAGLTQFAEPSIAAHGEHGLRPAQIIAWQGLAGTRAGLVLGPPGTGKTHLLSWFILGYIHARRAAGLSARVFVSAFTRNAIGNLLDAVSARSNVHWPDGFAIHFVGTAPPAGLSPGIRHRESLYGREGAAAIADLQNEAMVMGGSIWSLFRLLARPDAGGDDGYTAELFDLVCLDEASQIVLGHGLMSLGGLKAGGRVVVAGDDRQLPPIRTARDVTLGQRDLGGSLYTFLKSAEVPEFALDETFRLNEPLAAFPERKFYGQRYRSAVQTRRLALISDWKAGLEPWEMAVLDPDWPIAVLMHDGPPAATSNPFETGIAARLASKLAERMAGAQIGERFADDLWRDRLAIISPHRAQNTAIRKALLPNLRTGSFVETVDRIQGKERDAVIMSYCVADAEFALAEADFIFSPERLNVAVTRARTKLIVLISRRLLDAVPAEQEQMDKAELLREFAFGAVLKGQVRLQDTSGAAVNLQIRLLGFEDSPELEDLSSVTAPACESAVEQTRTPELEALLQAVRVTALASKYGTATIRELQKRLATREDLLPGLVRLHAFGDIQLDTIAGQYGRFWSAKPLSPPRRVFASNPEIVRQHIEEVISQSRRGNFAPFYEEVRKRFAWMNAAGTDVLKSIFDSLRDEGLLSYGMFRNSLTVDWVEPEQPQSDLDSLSPLPEILEEDFKVLNALEDLEASRINFGIFEGWTSPASVADSIGADRDTVTAALGRLWAAGWLMFAAENRVRSRMAELAREIRYVKQRFKRDDADERPFLVRSLKVELRNRDKPERKDSIKQIFADLAAEMSDAHGRALVALSNSLTRLWGLDARMAAFQKRGLRALTHAWTGADENAFVIAADTGSGKTEAAGLALIAAAAADQLSGAVGVRAILAYPRVRLVMNQAQRLVHYLAAFAGEPGMPTVTLGMQLGQVPEDFERLNDREREAGWTPIGSGQFSFPFFACPACGAELLLHHGSGIGGVDLLSCTKCNWRYEGWIGSKSMLRDKPPALFLPTMDSLHQWLHDPRYGRLFGDDPNYLAPRAFLADEIHLYSHVHGSQVGLALRRLAARVELNGPTKLPMLAIGMSATLGDPVAMWARLLQRHRVVLVAPQAGEKKPNPRGREYFFFAQPEVESRGQDIAGASTTIQAVMCLARGMRCRTGSDGGFRSLVFLDSIDKVRRLHASFDDAESQKRLAAYRTRLYPDDPATGGTQVACCGQPHGCDVFRDGECWFFAATDVHQHGARGRRKVGKPLRVADRPVFSGTSGRVESLIKNSDIVFTTSSLEVGYDDPDIALIYQHYAPQNLASFIQRKGRAGRGMDDRPITGTTLSIYSSRDSWWFRKPQRMIDPTNFDIPLNPDNHFVRRGQLLATILDALARYQRRGGLDLNVNQPPTEALREAEVLAENIFGPKPWREFGQTSLASLWSQALAAARPGHRLQYLSDVRAAVDWIPNLLFDTINVPQIRVVTGPADPTVEDIGLVLPMAAPGNATRRYDSVAVYWRPPIAGLGPWLASDDYRDGVRSRPFGEDPSGWLSRLPDDAKILLHNLSPDFFRPTRLSFETLGRMHGTGWQSDWTVPDATSRAPERMPGSNLEKRRVRHDSRGTLRGFPVVKVASGRGHAIDASQLAEWVEGIEFYVGDGLNKSDTGLALAQVYWAADAELNLAGPPADTAAFSQIFTAPDDNRPLLHGYHVHTEGCRFVLNRARLDAFVTSELQELERDVPRRRWHMGQLLRFLVESKALAHGVNSYESRRGADLMVSAAGDPELKGRLSHLLKFWSSQGLGELFEDTRAQLLSQHPLLSRERVLRVAQTLSDQRFQDVFKAAIRATTEEATFSRYIKSTVVHSLAVRLKQSFLQIGSGDERQVVMHVPLPIQFSDSNDLAITLCEAGAFGDGTTRSFRDRFQESIQHWHDGFINSCPNAREDAIMQRFFELQDHHETWRRFNPNDPNALASISVELGLDPESPPPAALLRILYGTETVGTERFDLYELALALHAVEQQLCLNLGRTPSPWELTSAVIEKARTGSTPVSGRLLDAYRSIEDAVQDESLSAEARLADQVYRLHTRLCLDGCRACVHQPSDMMSESLAEACTSRTLLGRFVGTG